MAYPEGNKLGPTGPQGDPKKDAPQRDNLEPQFFMDFNNHRVMILRTRAFNSYRLHPRHFDEEDQAVVGAEEDIEIVSRARTKEEESAIESKWVTGIQVTPASIVRSMQRTLAAYPEATETRVRVWGEEDDEVPSINDAVEGDLVEGIQSLVTNSPLETMENMSELEITRGGIKFGIDALSASFAVNRHVIDRWQGIPLSMAGLAHDTMPTPVREKLHPSELHAFIDTAATDNHQQPQKAT